MLVCVLLCVCCFLWLFVVCCCGSWGVCGCGSCGVCCCLLLWLWFVFVVWLMVWTTLRRTAQHFALFFPSPATSFALFLSHCVSSRGFLVVFGSAGAVKCARLEFSGCGVKPRRPPPPFLARFFWVWAPLGHDTHQIQKWIGQNWIGQIGLAKMGLAKMGLAKMGLPKMGFGQNWSNQDGQNGIGQSRSLPTPNPKPQTPNPKPFNLRPKHPNPQHLNSRLSTFHMKVC